MFFFGPRGGRGFGRFGEAAMTQDYGAARENMVENQVRTNDVSDFDVQDAMRLARASASAPRAGTSWPTPRSRWTLRPAGA